MKDPQTDLKAAHDYIVDHRTSPLDIEFERSRKARSERDFINSMIFKELFREGSPEWLMNYDPHATEARSEAAGGEDLPESYQARYREMQEWYERLRRRADFEVARPELGEVVQEQMDETWKVWAQEAVPPVVKKETEAERGWKDRADLAMILYDLKYRLKQPDLEFEPLSWPEPKALEGAYRKYYSGGGGLAERDEDRDERDDRAAVELEALPELDRDVL